MQPLIAEASTLGFLVMILIAGLVISGLILLISKLRTASAPAWIASAFAIGLVLLVLFVSFVASPHVAMVAMQSSPASSGNSYTAMMSAGEHQSEPSNPSWVKFMLFAATIIIVLALVFGSRIRAHLHFHPAGVLLFLLAVAGILLFALVGLRYTRGVRYAETEGALAQIHARAQPAMPDVPASVRSSSAPADAPADAPATELSTPLSDASKVPDNAPAWINDLPTRKGDSWFYVVRLDAADTTSSVREDWLDSKMLFAAEDYIDYHQHPSGDVSHRVKLDGEYLRANCVREYFPAQGDAIPGKHQYVKLEFDKKFQKEVDRQYREYLSSERLSQLAAISLAGLALLGGLYTYLRSTTAKSQPPLPA